MNKLITALFVILLFSTMCQSQTVRFANKHIIGIGDIWSCTSLTADNLDTNKVRAIALRIFQILDLPVDKQFDYEWMAGVNCTSTYYNNVILGYQYPNKFLISIADKQSPIPFSKERENALIQYHEKVSEIIVEMIQTSCLRKEIE